MKGLRVALAIAAGLVAVGCGSGDEPGSGSVEPSAEAPPSGGLSPRAAEPTGRSAALGEFGEFLSSDDPADREIGVYGLDSAGRELDTLVRLLQSDPDAEVRTAAVIQLGTSGGGPEVVSALVTALRDSDRNVVEAAVLALEDQQATSALPALEELSGHSDPEIRELARRAAEYLQLLTP